MQLASYIDHTLLKFNASQSDFSKLCDEALKYHFACVCVPPSVVKYLRNTYTDELKIASVVGFSLGYGHTVSKIEESKQLIEEGVQELDFVINFHWLNSGLFEKTKEEIANFIEICRKHNILSKIIIESGSLKNDVEDVICDMINELKPDFLKTSTGMLLPEYQVKAEEIARLRSKLDTQISIKASGGVRSKAQAISLIEAGATRLGTSSSLQLIAL